MPVFHTKTIESILEPVAQQVSRLVILHEEAEDGNAMPDLAQPVQVVEMAVENLVKVAYETINSSNDVILKKDMPPALTRVKEASILLRKASDMLKVDPLSADARGKLIDGSRGILQGTSALLLAFDESEVRKIIRVCKGVLEYVAVVEVVECMSDCVTFVKNLSPTVISMTKEVGARAEELTHQVHREMLLRSLDQVKTLTPVLISGMKIYITTKQSGAGVKEAQENRDFVVKKVNDEIHEIMRVLQLTTYDEDEWDADDITIMKKAASGIEGKMKQADDWLLDPRAVLGGVGEKSLRQILDDAMKVADRCARPEDREAITKAVNDINYMIDGLAELRAQGLGESPQAVSLARGIQHKLAELQQKVNRAVSNTEAADILKPAHTVAGKVEQAQRWLHNPKLQDGGLGEQATREVIAEGRKLADSLSGPERDDIIKLCDETERLTNQLSDLVRKGMGDSPQAKAIARNLSEKLNELKNRMQSALVDRVADDFLDIAGPLNQLTEASLVPLGTRGRDQNFDDKSRKFENHSAKLTKTAELLAAAGAGNNKRAVQAINSIAAQINDLAPQVVRAATVVFLNPNNQGAAFQHFELMKKQWTDNMEKLRDLVDEATDTVALIKAEEEGIRRDTHHTEDAIRQADPSGIAANTSSIARRANRIAFVAQKEAENSEDPGFVQRIGAATENLKSTITPMVFAAKTLTRNPRDGSAGNDWRKANERLIDGVRGVRQVVEEEFPPPPEDLPPPPDLSQLNLDAPPRPPLPNESVPPRPPPPETDDEMDDERHFPTPQANQPIMMAAHALHREVKQWSSKDNEIIAAAKRMALLMAKLSQLVRGEGGSKRELIATAKEIAQASGEVTRLANKMATDCTDKRMRTNLLQVCERIPTIGTQLKILSTVKATMLGAQGSDEDQEATDMLVGNAQNLMQSVRETVRAAQAASIKIRVDSGYTMRWVRRSPWYAV